ncbi:MAG: hypothetical protein QOE03_2387 [Micromonosporaceae bacterium]|nr:hypothetical protein [Micromonosporaceae bacterium]
MTNENPATANVVPVTAPEVILDTMMAKVGVDGLTAAMAQPGLLAIIDQHAAAVRDSLAGSGLSVSAVALAGYASSVAAASVRMGRALPDPATVDWSRASWFQLRLISVCALALEHECI